MYPPHHLGGYELSCRDVVDRWRRAGHQIEVLTTTMRVPSPEDPADERDSGVFRELTFYWSEHRMVAPSLWRRLGVERRNQQVLRAAIDRLKPDVVSVWHMGAMSMGLLTTIGELEIPMVLVVCDDWLIYGPRVDPWIRLFHRRPRIARAVRKLSGIPTTLPVFDKKTPLCFNSNWVRQRALARSPIPLRTTTVAYSGIDLVDFPIQAPRQREWKWRLLCVGRQETRKGTHIAVRALGELPRAQLEIVGPGDTAYLDELAKMASTLGVSDRVKFGNVSRSQLRNRYKSADVFLFPVIWDEPLGLVPLEAMACGTPVIATGTGGSAEFLIDGVNCLLVAKEDSAGLAAAVRRLSADQALRDRLVTAGIITAEEMSTDRYAAVLERWHEAAVERFASGRPDDLPPPAESLRSLR